MKTILKLAVLGAFLLPSSAFALEPYLGAQYALSKSSCQGFIDGVAPLGLTPDCDETASGFRVSGGLYLTENFGVEVGFHHGGEAVQDVKDARSGVHVLNLTAKFKAWDAVVTARTELAAGLVVIGRVGVAHWDYDVNNDAVAFNPTNDGNTLTYGGGLEYHAITAGYDAIAKVGQGNVLNPTAPEIKQTIHRFSVGIKYVF